MMALPVVGPSRVGASFGQKLTRLFGQNLHPVAWCYALQGLWFPRALAPPPAAPDGRAGVRLSEPQTRHRPGLLQRQLVRRPRRPGREDVPAARGRHGRAGQDGRNSARLRGNPLRDDLRRRLHHGREQAVLHGRSPPRGAGRGDAVRGWCRGEPRAGTGLLHHLALHRAGVAEADRRRCAAGRTRQAGAGR